MLCPGTAVDGGVDTARFAGDQQGIEHAILEPQAARTLTARIELEGVREAAVRRLEVARLAGFQQLVDLGVEELKIGSGLTP